MTNVFNMVNYLVIAHIDFPLPLRICKPLVPPPLRRGLGGGFVIASRFDKIRVAIHITPLSSLRESRLLLKRLDSWQSITKKLQKALFW
ncbi:hypothetical protein [Helicobacter sp. T3_23-1056]